MASTKLYVGNLFYDLTQEDLEAEFGKVRLPTLSPFICSCHSFLLMVSNNRPALKLTLFRPLFLSLFLSLFLLFDSTSLDLLSNVLSKKATPLSIMNGSRMQKWQSKR